MCYSRTLRLVRNRNRLPTKNSSDRIVVPLLVIGQDRLSLQRTEARSLPPAVVWQSSSGVVSTRPSCRGDRGDAGCPHAQIPATLSPPYSAGYAPVHTDNVGRAG